MGIFDDLLGPPTPVMTVGQVIEKLSTLPPDAPLWLWESGDYGHGPVTTLTIDPEITRGTESEPGAVTIAMH